MSNFVKTIKVWIHEVDMMRTFEAYDAATGGNLIGITSIVALAMKP